MPSRREQVIAAAVDAFAAGGLRELTHARVDRRAGVPAGTTSNHFRTRAALVGATVDRIAALRLAEADDAHDDALTVAWFDLLLQARRDSWVRDAIAPARARMAQEMARARPDVAADDVPALMALATSLEFARLVTGVDLRDRVGWVSATPEGH